jgi:hypothetical protein
MSLALGASSSTIESATSSSKATSYGRLADCRNRWRQTLCAIAISQFWGDCGRSPRWYARYALRKVVCATSSASEGFRRTARA